MRSFASSGAAGVMSGEISVMSLEKMKASDDYALTNLYRMPCRDRGGDGEGKSEGCSMAQPALHGHLSAKQFNQPAHQGETQTGPLVVRRVDPPEDICQPLCLNAPARITHRELHRFLLLLCL